MTSLLQVGTQKFFLKGEKRYKAYLYQLGRRRYSRRHFRTATAAMLYAGLWAVRAERYLKGAE